jgi:hypothetical protein
MIVGGVLFRFAIRQEVSYQSMVGGRITEAGVGQTLEINSREVRFSSQQDFARGQELQLAVGGRSSVMSAV